MSLRHFSDEELEKELDRRKAILNGPPIPLPEARRDYSVLAKTVIDCVETAIAEQYWDNDATHFIYEAAMEAVCGEEFWEWRNKQKW